MDIRNCTICPRNCGVDRTRSTGFCGAVADTKIGLYSLHHWEEPCISGESGSGTVFFSHCNMKCIFCQNYDISTKHHGKKVTADELSDIFLRLQDMGANNINLVTPTHYLFDIIPAIEKSKARGLKLPILYNSSGYEKVESLKHLDGLVDIYMPDFKYWRREFAEKYSACPNYPEIAKAAISEMFRQVGKPIIENGLMKKGMIVRHLLLPELLYDGVKIVEYLYNTYGDNIYISLMSQYTPLVQVANIPSLNKKVGSKEYEALCDFAAKIGVKNAFIQEGEAASESFIPEFYNY